MMACLKQGKECALVTIFELQGTGPRPMGAHMAVSAVASVKVV